MEPGTEVKIVNGLGIPDRLVGRVGVAVVSSMSNDQTLVRIPDEGSWWICNFRLEEVKDE